MNNSINHLVQVQNPGKAIRSLMNNTKVERAIYLQKKANDQIDTYGEASHDVVDELMEIVDSLNEGEQSLMLELYYSV
jgi:hypothetical protein